MNDILDVIINGFTAMFPKKRMWARDFEDDNSYGKVVAMLDQIIFMVIALRIIIICREITANPILLLLTIVPR